jgi:3-oxoacyl-[acyl-carrier-protein] synthase-3
MFKMDGRTAVSCVLKYLPKFFDRLCRQASLTKDDISLMILHQGSQFALTAVNKLLKLDSAKVMNIFREYGNQIATSIPMQLDIAVTTGRLRRGDNVMLLGTSAGISFGGAILRF